MDSTALQVCPGSFRDPAGTVFSDGTAIYRALYPVCAEQWQAVAASGFLAQATARGLVLEHEEIPPLPGAWKTLKSPLLPFVSYPHEWCFGQLKAAALHTLDVQDAALEHGCILRDATAYNIQFVGARPVFIDLLSFEAWDTRKPWKAYLQFCRHFLAPLALMAKRSVLCGKMSTNWVEGLPLELAAGLLPWLTKFSPTLGVHIHLHARMQARYADARRAAHKLRHLNLSDTVVPNLSKSLRLAVETLSLPRSLRTEWGDYYTDTNYSPQAAEDKSAYLRECVGKYCASGRLAVDLGANVSVYSEFLAETFGYVLAVDIDYLAIEKLYRQLRATNSATLLPLVLDLCNPSPGIGWDNNERLSFGERCQADYLSALAIVHHLVFTGGIPLPRLAETFASLVRAGGLHVLEFVPLHDSQVRRLLAARDESFPEYTLESCLAAFRPYFDVLETHPIADSQRTLLALRKRS